MVHGTSARCDVPCGRRPPLVPWVAPVRAATVEQLPFGDQRFDRVLSIDVLYCLEAPDEHAAVAEMHRVLRRRPRHRHRRATVAGRDPFGARDGPEA